MKAVNEEMSNVNKKYRTTYTHKRDQKPVSPRKFFGFLQCLSQVVQSIPLKKNEMENKLIPLNHNTYICTEVKVLTNLKNIHFVV